jgi:DNA-binding transcriptional MerR regulator
LKHKEKREAAEYIEEENKPMHTNLLPIGAVAELLGVRKHRIEYALAEKMLPEPQTRFLGKRVFAPADVMRIAVFFGKEAVVQDKGFEHKEANEGQE